ncbi:MAG: hypothetical protein WDA74_03955 [Spirochaetota bacterium]
MKRVLIVSLIFLAVFSGLAFGAEGRLLRWENRIDRLKELKISVKNTGETDKKITALIDRQIDESEKFVNVLIRAKAGHGSLRVEERDYSIGEIEKKVNESATEVISLLYVSALLNRPYNTPVKEKIGKEIDKYISEKNKGLSFKPGIDEREKLVLQYLLEEGMGEYKVIKEKLLRDILSKTEYDLSIKNYVTNEINLQQLIFKNSFDIVEAFDFDLPVKFNEKYLVTAPQWNFTASRIRTNEKLYEAMINFMKINGIEIPKDFSGKDIGVFEKPIFNHSRENLLASFKTEKFSGSKSYNTPLYEIPDFARMSEAVNELDKYRLALVKNMTGTEGEEFLKRVKNNNKGLSAKYIKHYENVFKREEARIESLKKGKPSIIIYNELIFEAAKNHFLEIKTDLKNYEELSSGFIERVVLSGSITVDEYISFHKYRISRLLEEAKFMQGLADNFVILSDAGPEKVSGVYRSVYNRGVAFVRDILKIDPLPSETRGRMTNNKLNEYSEINRNFSKSARLIASLMRKDYGNYTAALEERKALERKNAKDLENKIGEEEIRIYVSYVSDCANVLSGLDYTEKALINYRDKYNTIESDLKKNNLNEYNEIISKGSLISAVKNFDPLLIERETVAREFLSKEGEDALSSAAAVNTFYRRQGISMAHYPSLEELKALKLKLKPLTSVKVADWNMDGKNFQRVDLNVLEVLKKKLNKQAWAPGEAKLEGELVSFSSAGKGKSFSALIPPGWHRRSMESLVFDSPDKKGSIEIMAVNKGDKNFSSFPGQWLHNKDFNMVQQRWGKKGENDYHWSVSRIQGNRLAEVYMIQKDNSIIIIAGKSSDEKQKYLSSHIENVMDSLK